MSLNTKGKHRILWRKTYNNRSEWREESPNAVRRLKIIAKEKNQILCEEILEENNNNQVGDEQGMVIGKINY